MQWWTDFLDWLNSDTGWRIVSTAVIPFIAIIAAGIIAAMIGRASARKVIALSEREVRTSAVTALISAARKAAVWNTLPVPEQQHIDHLIGDSEIRLRLLPVAGTSMAADWASHEIAGMKRNAVSFSFQAEQSLLVFRDRLIEWQGRPGRARKLFKNDLDSWAYDSSVSEQEVVHQQQAWAAQQVTETGPIKTVTASPFTRPPAAAPLETELLTSAPAISPRSAAPSRSAPAEPALAEPALASTRTEAGTTTESPVEPAFSSPAGSAVAGKGLPALVEPTDDSPHDVSEASIFSTGEVVTHAADESHDANRENAGTERPSRENLGHETPNHDNADHDNAAEHDADEHSADEHNVIGAQHIDDEQQGQDEPGQDEHRHDEHNGWQG